MSERSRYSWIFYSIGLQEIYSTLLPKKFGKPHAVTGAIFNLLLKINFGSEITKDRRGSEDWSCLHFVQQVGVIIWKKKYSDIGSNLAQKQHPWCPSSFFIGYTSCNSTQMKIQDYTASTVKNSRAATGTFQAILVSKVCQKIQTTSGNLTILRKLWSKWNMIYDLNVPRWPT